MKPSGLARKLESRLGLLSASNSGRVTATIAINVPSDDTGQYKTLWECLGL